MFEKIFEIKSKNYAAIKIFLQRLMATDIWVIYVQISHTQFFSPSLQKHKQCIC